MLEFLFVTYFLGLVISLWHRFLGPFGLLNMQRKLGMNVFKDHPKIVRYCLFKVIFWPYYFMVEKSPLERFSEIFFKHYGDKGHCYSGTRGLRNFLNDIFKGKNRYQAYSIQHFVWELENPLEHPSPFGENLRKEIRQPEQTEGTLSAQETSRKARPEELLWESNRAFDEKFIEIILALHPDHCLFQAIFISHPREAQMDISRFMLDDCNQLSYEELKNQLKKYNLQEFKRWEAHHFTQD